MTSPVPVIAIDGPSASGKGTIARRVAGALGFHYLESGALYRVLGLISLRENSLDERRLVAAARTMDLRFQAEQIILENHDVTDKIRSEECGIRASDVARI